MKKIMQFHRNKCLIVFMIKMFEHSLILKLFSFFINLHLWITANLSDHLLHWTNDRLVVPGLLSQNQFSLDLKIFWLGMPIVWLFYIYILHHFKKKFYFLINPILSRFRLNILFCVNDDYLYTFQIRWEELK